MQEERIRIIMWFNPLDHSVELWNETIVVRAAVVVFEAAVGVDVPF